MKNNAKKLILSTQNSKFLFFIKENIWILGFGGVLYQLLFLIYYDAWGLFSWTQIPADSVFFILALFLSYIMAWPWFHDNFYAEKNSKIFYKSEILFFIIAFPVLIVLIYFIIVPFVWFLYLIFIQLTISVIFYIFTLIQRKTGKQISYFFKIFILCILIIFNCIEFGKNTYNEFLYIDKNTQKKYDIIYMNDKYILLQNYKVIKNDSSIILERVTD